MATTSTALLRMRRMGLSPPRTMATVRSRRRIIDVQQAYCSRRLNAVVSRPFSTQEEGAASTTPPIPSTTNSSSSSKIPAYMDLAKAKLSALVVTTTAAGFVAGSATVGGGPVMLDVLGSCIVGTALCASSAAAYNQIVEIDQDKLMKRTQQRPLVTGKLTTMEATTAATLWCGAGTSILYYGCDPLTAALGFGNVALYAGVYTSMKPRSVYNTWVGALVGAIPPIMGYSAATGGVFGLYDMQPWILASTLYLWQMPHFFALSYMYRSDYKRGGFQMVPCLENDGNETSKLIVNYTWYLSTIPLIAYATNTTSSMFALEGIALNAYFLKQAYQFRNDRTNANARKVFLTSLWYLPCLLMLFLLHSKVWDEETEQETITQQLNNDNNNNDAIIKWLTDTVHGIRNKGRDLCPHEVVIARRISNGETDTNEACPVTIASRQGEQGAEVLAEAVVTATATAATVKVTTTTDDDDANREV